MHDDDAPVTPELEEHEGYWTEARWEQFMLENEKLMARYEQVWKDDPDRKWHDPLDLYYKVHYDLDLGAHEAPEPPPPPEPAENESTPEPEEPIDHELDDFRAIPAYQLAYAFSLATFAYLKRFKRKKPGQDSLRDELCRHALRIAADIAGGHGLGYDEDAICGNIVKNRWALDHARESQHLFEALMKRDGAQPELAALLGHLPPIIRAIEERIAELRTKVWWN